MVHTERVDGFVVEQGPDVVVAAKPAVRVLCERLGVGGRLHGTSVRGAYVLQKGELRRMPAGLSGLVPTRLGALVTSRLLSPLGALRAAMEPWISRAPEGVEESVRAFVVRRLGREMYERLSEPLLTGIYAGDGRRLSIDATFPQLRAMEREHGSLLRALRVRPGAPPAASPFLSMPTGLGELIEALERALVVSRRVELRTATTVARVEAAPNGALVTTASGESMPFDAVIVATPAPVAASLLRDTDAALADEIAGIELGSTATVTLAYPLAAVPRPLDATGYVVPRVTGRPVLACTWASSKLPNRAPPGMALLRLFVGGAQRPELVDYDDAALIALAREELRTVLGIVAEPSLVRVTRWKGAMPQYNLGHGARVERIAARVARVPWLEIAGNAYGGVGVPDCIVAGEGAAERVLGRLA
jgi:oxygen-dependent protoporphyrinogen oxidase